MSRSFVFVTFQFLRDPPSSTSLPFFLECPSADRAFSEMKKTRSHGNHGAAAYGSLPPPVGRPHQFPSTVRVNRVMGGAAYDRRHRNQTGGRVLPNNPPWRLFWNKYTINSAAAYGSLPPPVGRPHPLLSTARVDRDMVDATYDRCHQIWSGGASITQQSTMAIVLKKIAINGAAAYGSLPPPVGRPRPFRSMARVDRVMGDPPYYWRHRNQAGVRALRYNPPWWFESAKKLILGAAGHGLHMPQERKHQMVSESS